MTLPTSLQRFHPAVEELGYLVSHSLKLKRLLDLTIPKHIPLLLGHCSPTLPDTLPDWPNAGLVVFRGDEDALSALHTSLKAVEVDSTVTLVMS